MNKYQHINIYKILEPDFIAHIVATELADAAENAEDMHMRTAAKTVLGYFTVQQPDDGHGKADS